MLKIQLIWFIKLKRVYGYYFSLDCFLKKVGKKFMICKKKLKQNYDFCLIFKTYLEEFFKSILGFEEKQC